MSVLRENILTKNRNVDIRSRKTSFMDFSNCQTFTREETTTWCKSLQIGSKMQPLGTRRCLLEICVTLGQPYESLLKMLLRRLPAMLCMTAGRRTWDRTVQTHWTTDAARRASGLLRTEHSARTERTDGRTDGRAGGRTWDRTVQTHWTTDAARRTSGLLRTEHSTRTERTDGRTGERTGEQTNGPADGRAGGQTGGKGRCRHIGRRTPRVERQASCAQNTVLGLRGRTEKTDGWTSRRASRWAEERTDNGRTCEWADGRMDGQKGGRAEGQMDGWADV